MCAKSKSQYGLISEIRVDDPSTWQGRTFLTLDVDWAHDVVLSHCIDVVEGSGMPATWFITHDTPLLERLRENECFELGIHPNFNNLLEGTAKPGDTASRIIQDILSVVPEAKAVRSHSLVNSERLIDIWHEAGLTHVSNVFIPESGLETLSPWLLWSNMTIVPHCWQDNVSMRLNGDIRAPVFNGIKSINVYDFHPIHIFLNAESIDTYEAARPLFQTPEKLKDVRNAAQVGAEDILKEVMSLS